MQHLIERMAGAAGGLQEGKRIRWELHGSTWHMDLDGPAGEVRMRINVIGLKSKWAVISDKGTIKGEARTLDAAKQAAVRAAWAKGLIESVQEARLAGGGLKYGPASWTDRKSGNADAVHGVVEVDPRSHTGVYVQVQGAGSKRWEFTMSRSFAVKLADEIGRALRATNSRKAEDVQSEGKDPQIAKTILKQLGGSGRLSAMIGANTFIDHGNGVSFKFPQRDKPSKRGNYLKITLNGLDYYDLEFQYLRGYNSRVVKEFTNIEAGQLRSVIERQIGMRLSL